jgi:transposase
MGKVQPVATDVKRQILERIKAGGVSISQIAEEHGISNRTIYGWLSRGATSAPSWLELNRYKKENAALKELLGKVMLEIEFSKKKN